MRCWRQVRTRVAGSRAQVWAFRARAAWLRVRGPGAEHRQRSLSTGRAGERGPVRRGHGLAGPEHRQRGPKLRTRVGAESWATRAGLRSRVGALSHGERGPGLCRGWGVSGTAVLPRLTVLPPAVCSAAASGLSRDELHNEVLHKGGEAPVPATAPLLGGSLEKESGGAASGDELSELPRGTGGKEWGAGRWVLGRVRRGGQL